MSGNGGDYALRPAIIAKQYSERSALINSARMKLQRLLQKCSIIFRFDRALAAGGAAHMKHKFRQDNRINRIFFSRTLSC